VYFVYVIPTMTFTLIFVINMHFT